MNVYVLKEITVITLTSLQMGTGAARNYIYTGQRFHMCINYVFTLTV